MKVLVKLEIIQFRKLCKARKFAKEDLGEGVKRKERKMKRLSRRYHTVLRKTINVLIWIMLYSGQNSFVDHPNMKQV